MGEREDTNVSPITYYLRIVIDGSNLECRLTDRDENHVIVETLEDTDFLDTFSPGSKEGGVLKG